MKYPNLSIEELNIRLEQRDNEIDSLRRRLGAYQDKYPEFKEDITREEAFLDMIRHSEDCGGYEKE